MGRDDIQDMRITLAIRQERKASMQWYWLLAALPVAGVFIGLVWAAFSPAPASAPHPGYIRAEAAMPVETAGRAGSVPDKTLARGRMATGDRLIGDVRADLEKAGFDEMTEQIRLYDSTMMTLGRCRKHNFAGFEAAQTFYERRNKPAYGQWRKKLDDLRNANMPEAGASNLEIIASAASGKLARQSVATMAMLEFDLNGPAPANLSATECAALRNEVQSGSHDLRAPGLQE